jgi:hypothetical protein
MAAKNESSDEEKATSFNRKSKHNFNFKLKLQINKSNSQSDSVDSVDYVKTKKNRDNSPDDDNYPESLSSWVITERSARELIDDEKGHKKSSKKIVDENYLDSSSDTWIVLTPVESKVSTHKNNSVKKIDFYQIDFPTSHDHQEIEKKKPTPKNINTQWSEKVVNLYNSFTTIFPL